ncbi:DUF726 domain-containing protein [Rhodococcus sp. RS1C4]|uniref:DUF726 domain-containing protein n=1 Tax=Rhodococcus sp. 114MFTsu3.1 TaxID=1172184 RepID=UPI000380BB59|nr:DUF726 domain-containing protein [Rhodococcus sp. 114MFTsu3.1]OZC48468.1 DUF726 domain-containing protein [Rhodococcus sp. RS1C4]
MGKSAEVEFRSLGQAEFECEVRSPEGLTMRCNGALGDLEPRVLGDDALGTNIALVHNAWAFAKHDHLDRTLTDGAERTSHREQARAHRKTAAGIAELIDKLGSTSKTSWCSACFTRSDHRRLTQAFGTIPAYLCESCGSPTLGCAGPGCANMATRGFAAVLVPRYCAEHKHDIPGFEKASTSFGVLEDYHEFLKFERRNLALGSRVAAISVLSAGALATGAFLAAPAIGGAIGSLSIAGGGYTGAAATSYGLALLGGGSIAAGGLGMAGGTAVVAAVGGALGGALGSSVTTAYIGADKSFNIELIKPGSGIPVIVANGLFSEGSDTRADWKKLITRRYPDSPIYRVHWGSNDLGDLAAMVKALGGQPAAVLGVKGLAAKAGKAGAKKLGPLAPALVAAALAKNPWHTARVKADRTGVALAGLLARTDAKSYVLIGHSLGARVAATAAETLATSKNKPRIDTVHLLGAAIGAKGDWRLLSKAVTGAVHNYHSSNDAVLKWAYKTAQAGQSAVGFVGFRTEFARIHDHNVSAIVAGHSKYLQNVQLC